MSGFKDLTGMKFGRLTVLYRSENGMCSGKPVTRWMCRCDCGIEKTVDGHSLARGRTKSCGCLNAETRKRLLTERATTHGGCYTRLYHIWAHMKYRCYNPNDAKYKDYGGRGITVCSEWLAGFENFRGWALSSGYSDNLSLDRIDVDGNYEPSNCRWATWRTQRMNQRRMLNRDRTSASAMCNQVGAATGNSGEMARVSSAVPHTE